MGFYNGECWRLKCTGMSFLCGQGGMDAKDNVGVTVCMHCRPMVLNVDITDLLNSSIIESGLRFMILDTYM